jgi:ATP-binding cassette subfamily B protein
MNAAVYRHILSVYGRVPLIWVGLAMEAIRTILARVVGIIYLAHVTQAVAVHDAAAARSAILGFFLTYAGAAIIGSAGELISLNAENVRYQHVSVDYYLKLTGKDMAFYRDHQSGYLVGLFRQYLDGMLEIVRFVRNDLIRTIISLTFPAAILFTYNHTLGYIAWSIIAIQLVYITWASAKMTPLRTRSHEIYRQVTGEVADIITNIVAFKASGKERQARSRVQKLAEEETAIFADRRSTRVLLDLPRDLITNAGMALALYVVVTSGGNSHNLVAATVLTVTYMIQIIRNVGDVPQLVETQDNYVAKVFPAIQYLGSTQESVADPPHPKPLNIGAGVIQLDHVSFSYPSDNGQRVSVFSDLSVTIEGGEKVGIVGLSGAGKSTLASLLMRFDDVQEGAIRIDGTDLREVRQSELRRQIAYVPQEPLLFHRSIRDNIAYFDEHATQADIERAARAAHAHHFVDRLPQAYDSMVGERGVKLSGGQKQRIVIARSILKNAPIMLFDEATSALDSESEQIIQRALPGIMGHHTAIVIAHRLSTIAGLDRILVMHDGVIVEQGSHDELLALDGRYARLWHRQVEGQAAVTT